MLTLLSINWLKKEITVTNSWSPLVGGHWQRVSKRSDGQDSISREEGIRITNRQAVDSGGNRQKLRGMADKGEGELLRRVTAVCPAHIKIGVSCHFYWGSGGLEMGIKNTECPNIHVIGVKPEASTQSQRKLNPVVCLTLELELRAHVRAQMEQIEFCWVPGFWLHFFSWWEFRLHLKLASSSWQAWQYVDPQKLVNSGYQQCCRG